MMDKLRSAAAFVAIAGLVSSVLSLIGYNLRLLMWIDMWGEGVGWGIRIGLVLLGGLLFFLLPSSPEEQSAEASGGTE